MNIREILLTELWSKQASRKAWKSFGVTSAVIILLIGLVAVVEVNWLTPSERKSAKHAMSEIENLPKFQNVNLDVYRVHRKQAEAAVDAAVQNASTLGDKKTGLYLSLYESFVDMQVMAPIVQVKENEFYKAHPEKHHPETLQQQELRRQTVQQAEQLKKTTAKSLHRDLN